MSTIFEIPMLIGGDWRPGKAYADVIGPWRKETVSKMPLATKEDIDDALNSAMEAKAEVAAMPGYERAAILRRAGELIRERAEDIGKIMAREIGREIKNGTAEVKRSQDTISLSAEEAIRIEGEQVPLEGSATGTGKIAMLLRFPVGVVVGITPFNAPFNLACHKIGPAIAAGNAIVLKASPQAPGVVHKLAEIFVDAGLPAGFLNVLYGHADVGEALVKDPRTDFISFTGSSRAGAHIKQNSGLKRIALELGGNGPSIVCEDADIETAAPVCASNSSRLAGQSCISVQNVLVHERLFDAFVERMIPVMNSLRVGDPMDMNTDVGCLVDEAAAQRVEAWVNEARAAGAMVHTGGERKGAQYKPTLLSNVNSSMKVVRDEVFGPVLSVRKFKDVDEAIREVNSSNFGLQCGIFTKSLETGIKAAKEIRTGGIIINGSSTWRTDQLAYGGVKDSGIGREGPRYAIREMTEQRLIVFNL
ncbi:MAG: aldehyde dehydrogenase family protein [SAR324 cluster bacterium]|nr:aldehyde dehydrogenase family protein [SAR324 cluster bacterium]